MILTDPPDTISHKTEMNKHYNDMKENEENDIDFIKSDEECHKYIITIGDDKKESFMKHGTIDGKKICCGN